MTEVCQTSSPVSADPGEVMKIETQIMCMSFRPPLFDDKIFKDECMYCFKTPLDADGLFICLERFAGFCIDHVLIYCKRTARKAFLWYKQTKVLLTKSEEPEDKVTKLALGVEGGFSSGLQFRLVDEYAVIICPMFHIKVSLSRLPPKTQEVCQKIIDDEGVRRQEALEAGVSVWEGDERKNTLHLNLKQANNGKRIPPRGWKCEEEGCDLRENLWMNLTDGAIMCGRSQYVQEGVMSKGQNHARLHFDLTGYPLVVKLGTITKDDADVFSYDEDCSVRDPNLKKHLKHFGIDMDKAEKTEKSTLEMELDLNQKWEWEMCQEDGANLELAYGPGLTGIINIGSSCYISASLQLLLQIPDFVNIYGTEFEKHYLNVPILDSHTDFNCQTAKVFSSLLSGEFSKKDGICNGIKPTQFRKIVSRGNAEFSSMRQQDADEYLRYSMLLLLL
ncbi:unnamed protein product [Thelazia callipaeda]|uniref:ubiquitinyl hydrolase 1 n=1 Tax=Thelazia callipaeda TaxID=103827 RepID=A0A0N5CQF6_THECL|nr:unnamed protein product [Thelazia callipaeda]